MPKPLAFPSKLDRFPPVVIRLLARDQHGRRVVALTDAQIVHRSGLSLGEVRHLSRQTSWGDITIDAMLAFCKGCGANFDNRRWIQKNSTYMDSIKGLPKYLVDSPEWATTFEPLIATWLRHEQAA